MKKIKVPKNKTVKIKKNGIEIYSFKTKNKSLIETNNEIIVL